MFLILEVVDHDEGRLMDGWKKIIRWMGVLVDDDG